MHNARECYLSRLGKSIYSDTTGSVNYFTANRGPSSPGLTAFHFQLWKLRESIYETHADPQIYGNFLDEILTYLYIVDL